MQNNVSAHSAHYILNPNSGRYKKNKAKFDFLFNHYRIPEHQIHLTAEPGDATKISKDIALHSPKLIFAVGGDGTVNETARGMLGTNSILGIIPMGSGNGFARHLKTPMEAEMILSNIASARVVTVDVGYCNDRPFLATSSVGLSAKIALHFEQFAFRGPFPYFFLTTKNFFTAREFFYEMEVDGRIEKGSALDITVANANQFGNGAIIAPDASIADGLLDIVIVRKPRLGKAPYLAKRLFDGRIMEMGEFSHLRGKEVIIKLASEETQSHIDGEPVLFHTNSIRWHIEPGKLKVISF